MIPKAGLAAPRDYKKWLDCFSMAVHRLAF